jgi:two-component system KDP operon response regulator KdpE
MALPKPLVLVIDDDAQARKLVRRTLRSAFRLSEAQGWFDALARTRADRPDAILLDPTCRSVRGLKMIEELRLSSSASILVVSKSTRELDKVRALESGADDYITKPFGRAEFVARIRASTRRHDRAVRGPSDSVIAIGDLRLDLDRRLVFVGGAEVHLTPVQYRLFWMLMKNAGAVLTQKELVEEVWGRGDEAQTLCLRVHMSQLRRKLEKDPRRPQYLITEPAIGYRIRAASDALM